MARKNAATVVLNGIIFFITIIFGITATSDIDGDSLDRYLGCFYNDRTQNPTGDVRTPDECIEQCGNSSVTYARLQNGLTCQCVDKYGIQIDDRLCNITLEGRPPLYIAFQLPFSTYVLYAVCPIGTFGSKCDKECHCKSQIPCNRENGTCPNGCHGNYTGTSCNMLVAHSADQYIGCFQDNTDKRALSHNVYNSVQKNNYNTPRYCTSQCSLSNFSYAGTQYGYQCFCGESYAKYGGLKEAVCNNSCSGNSSEICGGEKALSVYHTCPSGQFGKYCSKICNCKTGSPRCSFESGSCKNGCKDGWSGHSCSVRDCNMAKGNCISVNESCVSVKPSVSQTIGLSVCRCDLGYVRAQLWANCTDTRSRNCTDCGQDAISCYGIGGAILICDYGNGTYVMQTSKKSATTHRTTLSTITSMPVTSRIIDKESSPRIITTTITDVIECHENSTICGPNITFCSNNSNSSLCCCPNVPEKRFWIYIAIVSSGSAFLLIIIAVVISVLCIHRRSAKKHSLPPRIPSVDDLDNFKVELRAKMLCELKFKKNIGSETKPKAGGNEYTDNSKAPRCEETLYAENVRNPQDKKDTENIDDDPNPDSDEDIEYNGLENRTEDDNRVYAALDSSAEEYVNTAMLSYKPRPNRK